MLNRLELSNPMPPYAETPRLLLRALEERDLPRVTELIGDWDVTKWLIRVPHPYTLDDAKQWLDLQKPAYEKGEPEFLVIANINDDAPMGGIGAHPQTGPDPKPDELELGYWLGKPYWKQGIMSEAVPPVLALAFARPHIKRMTSFTDIDNMASQNVLRKTGFRFLGTSPRTERDCLRGSTTVTRWEQTRADVETR